MSFSNHTKTVIGIAFLTVALAAMAAIGMAAVTDMANEQVQFDNESNLTVGVDWNESAASDATADVTVQHESAYQIDNDTVTDSHLNSTTLSGTTAEFDTANVTDGTSYDVELDSSATTVTVPSTAIASDGTVDLSNHTADSITADDTILSATVMADDVVSETFTADPGNETNATYTESDGLVDGTSYRVIVSADDTEADSVTVDDGSIGGLFGGSSDGTPGFGVGVAIAAIGTAGAVARRKAGGS